MHPTKIFGLNGRGKKYIAGERVIIHTDIIERMYPNRQIETPSPVNVYGSTVQEEPSGEKYEGRTGEFFPLRKFTFTDGRVLYERLQEDWTYPGIIAFFALYDEWSHALPDSLWTEAEMENAVCADAAQTGHSEIDDEQIGMI